VGDALLKQFGPIPDANEDRRGYLMRLKQNFQRSECCNLAEKILPGKGEPTIVLAAAFKNREPCGRQVTSWKLCSRM